VFQETADKIVIIAKMPSYSKEEIAIAVTQKEIMLIWHKNAKDQTSDKQIKQILHKNIEESDICKIKKVSYVERVGFVAFMFEK
jgi:HSP20 family molecular chaperone IbpA